MPIATANQPKWIEGIRRGRGERRLVAIHNSPATRRNFRVAGGLAPAFPIQADEDGAPREFSQPPNPSSRGDPPLDGAEAEIATRRLPPAATDLSITTRAVRPRDEGGGGALLRDGQVPGGRRGPLRRQEAGKGVAARGNQSDINVDAASSADNFAAGVHADRGGAGDGHHRGGVRVDAPTLRGVHDAERDGDAFDGGHAPGDQFA